MRTCNYCHKEKPLDFDHFGRGGESNGYFQPYCRECSPFVQAPYHAKYKEKRAKEKRKQLHLTGQMFLGLVGM